MAQGQRIKLSFIIPALNEEAFIGDCIRSILPQITKGDEIIVVDNGSTDKTASISKKLGARVVGEKKRGISHARNKGASVARGDIYCFVDADAVLGEKWATVARSVFKNPMVEVAVGVNIFTHENKLKMAWYNVYTVIVHTFFIGLPNYLFGRLWLSGNNLAMRRELFNKLGGYEPVIGEDYWMSLKYWGMKRKKGVFRPKMVIYLSSRGFDAEGYLKTIYFWIVSAMGRVSQEEYSYKNKRKPPKKA